MKNRIPRDRFLKFSIVSGLPKDGSRWVVRIHEKVTSGKGNHRPVDDNVKICGCSTKLAPKSSTLLYGVEKGEKNSGNIDRI